MCIHLYMHAHVCVHKVYMILSLLSSLFLSYITHRSSMYTHMHMSPLGTKTLVLCNCMYRMRKHLVIFESAYAGQDPTGPTGLFKHHCGNCNTEMALSSPMVRQSPLGTGTFCTRRRWKGKVHPRASGPDPATLHVSSEHKFQSPDVRLRKKWKR